MNFFKRLKCAYNAYTGRFTTLDSDGFPVFTTQTATGLSMSADRALYSTAVFACVNLLSSVIASIPLVTYEDKNGKVTEAKNNPLHKLLMYKPNHYQTAYDYWLYNMECVLLRGGFVSWINRGSSGKIYSLIPVSPDTVIREITDDGRLVFSGLARWGEKKYLKFDRVDQDQFFWCNYRTLDSVHPCSPIKYAAESIALSITAEEHGARVFQNDATPPLVIQYPEKLNKENMLALAKMWKSGGTGKNYGMPRFLDGGAKIERLSMSNEDAQYLESRKFQRDDICGIFRVPPSMVGDTTRAQGWSTLEQKNSEFLTYTLSPYLTNIEQAVNRSLIPEPDWGRYYVDFNSKVLMRADITGRTAYYRDMFNISALSPNEIRAEEGYNEREGGDVYGPLMPKTEINPEKKEVEKDDEQEEI